MYVLCRNEWENHTNQMFSRLILLLFYLSDGAIYDSLHKSQTCELKPSLRKGIYIDEVR